jgi:hypothetical protein
MSSVKFQEFWGNFVTVVIDMFLYRDQDLSRAEKIVKPHPRESNSARQVLEARLRPARVDRGSFTSCPGWFSTQSPKRVEVMRRRFP